MTRDEASRLVAIAAAASPSGARLTRAQLADMRDAWAIAMDDIPYAVAERALAVAMRTSPYVPAVADIVRAATELRNGPVRTGADAWGDVRRAMGRWGSYAAPGRDFEFDDPVVAGVVRSFGWRELCASGNTTSDRARFIDEYDQAAAQARREEHAPQLASARGARLLVGGVAKALRSPDAAPPTDPLPWDDDR